MNGAKIRVKNNVFKKIDYGKRLGQKIKVTEYLCNSGLEINDFAKSDLIAQIATSG